LPTTGKLRASFSAAGEQFQTTQETECFLESRRFKGGKSEKTKTTFHLRKYSFFLRPCEVVCGGVGGIETTHRFWYFWRSKVQYNLFKGFVSFSKSTEKIKTCRLTTCHFECQNGEKHRGIAIFPVPLETPSRGRHY